VKKYKEISKENSYRLTGYGPLVLVASIDEDGISNVMPVAWNCPVSKEGKFLVVIGKAHETFKNISNSKKMVICIPHESQKEMVMQTGTNSSRDVYKYDEFNIKNHLSHSLNIEVPDDCIGYIECKIETIFDGGNTALIVGTCLYAEVDEEAFEDRLLFEKDCAKTLHHLGGDNFFTSK